MRHIDSLWLPHPNFVVHWLQLSGVTVSQLSDVLDCCEAFESGSVGHPAMQETWARKRCPWVVSRLEQESVPPWQEPLVEAQMPQGVARSASAMASSWDLRTPCRALKLHIMTWLGWAFRCCLALRLPNLHNGGPLFSWKADARQWCGAVEIHRSIHDHPWYSVKPLSDFDCPDGLSGKAGLYMLEDRMHWIGPHLDTWLFKFFSD